MNTRVQLKSESTFQELVTKVPVAESERAPRKTASQQDKSLVQRIGSRGIFSLTCAGLLCLANLVLYAMLPLASLAFLPFFFVGIVCLMSGTADDLGFYD